MRSASALALAIVAALAVVAALQRELSPAVLAASAASAAAAGRQRSVMTSAVVARAKSKAQRAAAALKDTHLFWGAAVALDDDDGPQHLQQWRDSDAGLQAVADDALRLCDEVRGQEARGEEAVQGQGPRAVKGRQRHCVHRVVPRRDTRFTHAPAGQNDWTQPLRNTATDGEPLGPEHNAARSLQKVIDAFKPHTTWHGKTIFDRGVMVHIPTYDRTAFRGFHGASTAASLVVPRKAGATDHVSHADESYDQMVLDAEEMMGGGGASHGRERSPVPPARAKSAAASRGVARQGTRSRDALLTRPVADPLMATALRHHHPHNGWGPAGD